MRKLKIKLESLKTENQELKLQESKNKDCDRTYCLNCLKKNISFTINKKCKMQFYDYKLFVL